MKKIALISDTHNILRDEVEMYIKNCDYILHAGDVCNMDVLEKVESFAPTIVVRGNNDSDLTHLPLHTTVTIEDVTIYITHQKKDIQIPLKDINIVMYGHSHIYESYEIEGIQYINPGSCGRKRFSLALTMAYLYIDKGSYSIEKIDIHG